MKKKGKARDKIKLSTICFVVAVIIAIIFVSYNARPQTMINVSVGEFNVSADGLSEMNAGLIIFGVLFLFIGFILRMNGK